MAETRFDLLLKAGRVLDPASGLDDVRDVAVQHGRIAEIAPDLDPHHAAEVVDVSGQLVIAGMIDTHAHVYEHVTGKFGLNPDLVGVRSGTTTVVDQGGPSCMTIRGFRHFIAEQSASRVLCYISAYLVGGLEGHFYPDLYGPTGVNVKHTVSAINENRDLVKGIKAHAEIGGASRWGLEVMKLAKQISHETGVPLYIHLGQLWPSKEQNAPDADELIRELVPLMTAGDVLAHPFTRHPGGFVSAHTRQVHPVILQALDRGVRIDVGHGSHFSFEIARLAFAAGIRPHTLGADLHGYNVSLPGEGDDERAQNPFYGSAPFNLTIAMTELLELGMALEEVVATVTSGPARLLGVEDELGALTPGRTADVSVLEQLPGQHMLSDNSGNQVITESLIVPRFALKAGRRYNASSAFVPPPVAYSDEDAVQPPSS